MLAPTTEKRRLPMQQYINHIMNAYKDVQNETIRARKRKLKEDYKKYMGLLNHKALYTNPATAME